MITPMATQEVGDGCDFEGLLRRERLVDGAFAGGGDVGGLEGFVSEEALVDDVVAVAEDGGFVGGGR